jgi:hypothetical protein
MKLSLKRFVFKTGKSYFEVNLRFILFEFSGGHLRLNLVVEIVRGIYKALD